MLVHVKVQGEKSVLTTSGFRGANIEIGRNEGCQRYLMLNYSNGTEVFTINKSWNLPNHVCEVFNRSLIPSESRNVGLVCGGVEKEKTNARTGNFNYAQRST